MESTSDQKTNQWVLLIGIVGWLAIVIFAIGYAWTTSARRFDERLLRESRPAKSPMSLAEEPLIIEVK